MAEHIRDEYFVTRDVVTYNGSALERVLKTF